MIWRLFHRRISSKKSKYKNIPSNIQSQYTKESKLSTSLSVNLLELKEILGNSKDVNIRELNIGIACQINAAIVLIDGLVDKDFVNEHIMKSLMKLNRHIVSSEKLIDKHKLLNIIKTSILTVSNLYEISTLEEVIDRVLSGHTVLFIEGSNIALNIDTAGYESRSVEEPATESVVRGPREGFTESIKTNIALLRRKIKSSKFVLEDMKIGTVTRTDICIAYIKGIANEKIIEELKKRLGRIEIDGILESGYIEEYIEDKAFTIFPQIGNTEKPDIVAAKLLEGRIAVITDGTPTVLTLPYIFVESLQAAEDYYSRPWFVTFIRWIRFAALCIAVFLPAVYISAQTYHFEMIPTPLIITMAESREGIPFPAFVEILLMAFIFEILKEAGVRMPKPIGQAVSIVGSLVLGQAAVDAGLVSNPALMVTAMSGISGLVISSQNDSVTLLRFIFILLGAFAGLFGVLVGFIFLLIHLTALRSFGAPYLSPLAPMTISNLKDVLIRAPLWAMKKRPRVIGWKNLTRLKENNIPISPIHDKDDDI